MQNLLEENKIIVQQACYGEVNRAHSVISQSENDPELTSFLITFTDRPAALPPGVELMPYLSGVAFTRYYIFTKTFPDPFATRAGMVFTHALILKLSDIYAVNNLDDILSNFVNEVPEERYELKPIDVTISKKISGNNKTQPKFVQESIKKLLLGATPILFSGNIESFKIVLQRIWNSPDTEFRKKIKFRTSFTPSDIEGVKDLSIVSIQKEFLTKWIGYTIIQSENNDSVELNSYSELLFLGIRQNNPLYQFISELKISPIDFQIYEQSEKVYASYINLDKIRDANILRQDIRVLSKLSPNPKDGETYKLAFSEKLEFLFEKANEKNLKALRNIEWSAFSNGEKTLEKIIYAFFKNNLITSLEVDSVAEVLDIACNEEAKTKWHYLIQNSFKLLFDEGSDKLFENILVLLNHSEATFNNVFSLLDKSSKTESALIKGLTRKYEPKIEIRKTFENRLLERKWFWLYANLLVKYLSLNDALKKQLDAEKTLDINASRGLKFIADKVKDEELLRLALLTTNLKLISLVVERIVIDNSLLNKIDLNVLGWMDIWALFLEKTQDISRGIEGKEQEILEMVFDQLVQGAKVPELIIELIAHSQFANIYKYKQRAKLLNVIPLKYLELFLNPTAKEFVKKVISGEEAVVTIEQQLLDKITSDKFMTDFLRESGNSIRSVIKIYDTFPSLRDDFLADYITYYKNAISHSEAMDLGNLVNRNAFGKSAKSIYDKTKYSNSFKLAFEYCSHLVNINWWGNATIKGTDLNSNMTHPVFTPQIQPAKNYGDLPIVVILTAIKEEYMAVRNHLTNIGDAVRNDTRYETGIFEFNGREIARMIIRECGAKNTNSAMETERAIQYFSPNIIFFVGIAGSRKPNDFTIGDVIFPEKIYSYEAGKSEKDSFKPRPDLAGATYVLSETAKSERRREGWKILIKNILRLLRCKALGLQKQLQVREGTLTMF